MKPEEFVYPLHPPMNAQELTALDAYLAQSKLAYNIIVDNGCKGCNDWGASYILQLDDKDKVHIVSKNYSIWDLLILVGSFDSKSRARKQWKGPQDIPSGFTSWKLGRKDPKLVFIWNPVDCYCEHRLVPIEESVLTAETNKKVRWYRFWEGPWKRIVSFYRSEIRRLLKRK